MSRAGSTIKSGALMLTTLAGAACAPRLEPPSAALRTGMPVLPLVHASNATLEVGWRPLRALEPPGAVPVLFVHLLDPNGRLVRTFDRHVPGTWTSGPRRDWEAVEETIEIWQSALAEPLPAGSYRLTAGAYDIASGRRWRLETTGAEIDDGEYEIAAIEVAAAESETPSLTFAGEWLAPQAGQPHNPGRRWMGESGSILLRGTAGWSQLALSLSITDLSVGRHVPIFDDGADDPRLVIGNGCDGDSETLIDGYGVRSVTLALDTGGDCAITFEPNFVMLDLKSFARRSIGLESAFFRR